MDSCSRGFCDTGHRCPGLVCLVTKFLEHRSGHLPGVYSPPLFDLYACYHAHIDCLQYRHSDPYTCIDVNSNRHPEKDLIPYPYGNPDAIANIISNQSGA